MELLQRKKRTLETTIETLKVHIETLNETNTSIIDLDGQHADVVKAIKDLEKIHDKISDQCDDELYLTLKPDLDSALTNLLGSRTKVNVLKAKLLAANPQPQPTPQQNQQSSGTCDFKLPRLDIPKFNGDHLQWLSFRDMFCSMVHNNPKLTDGVQKMGLLLQSLEGSALDLVRSFAVTNSSYTEAWTTLTQRYQHTRELVNAHLKRLLDQPSLHEEHADSIRRLVDTSRECVRSLKLLKIPVSSWDALLNFLITQKLDPESRRLWELSMADDTVPKFDHLLEFLEKRSKSLSVMALTKEPSKPTFSSKPRPPKVTTHHASLRQCPICNNDHRMNSCPKFINMSIDERKRVCKDKGCCFNCLRGDHSLKACNSSNCRKCGKRHHTLLHVDANPQVNEATVSTNTAAVTDPVQRSSDSLLGTAIILLKDSQGRLHKCRALMDNGSQASFISERCMHILNLPRRHANVTINTLGSNKNSSHGAATVSVHSLNDPDFQCYVDFLVLSKVTHQLPNVSFMKEDWAHTNSLVLADPDFNKSAPIDVLLGVRAQQLVIRDGLKNTQSGGPLATNTAFGWVLSGDISKPHNNTVVCNHLTLEQSLQRFWEIEEIDQSQPMSQEEASVERHFVATHTRLATGRFVVRLPIQPGASQLGASRNMAINRLRSQERRLLQDPDKYRQYREFMNEYINMGHMRLVHTQVPSPTTQCYYLPHHAVVKTSSTTTKLRVVFDASAKTSNGLSLNGILQVGPKTQEDLYSILIRFRTHPVALVADVEKMYRMIKVHEDDVSLQRIVWRNSTDEPIQDYELLTVTYGTASAPYAATRCLKQLALDEKEKYPAASQVVLRDFYVDDLVSGTSSTQEAISLSHDINSLMKCGEMNLRKWLSNDLQVLASLPHGDRSNDDSFFIQDGQSVSTLGIKWHPHSDEFSTAAWEGPSDSSFTKRVILSEVAKLYDPMGWLAPAVVKAKILLQSLWQPKVEWDEEVSQDVAEQWDLIRQQLPLLGQVRLPRYALMKDATTIELHAFSDSSEAAYAAVVYVRCIGPSGVTVQLLTAKTRVAPLKKKSLPRLELCGALLAAQLVLSVSNSLSNLQTIVYGWTDSTIVLAWLASPPTRWTTFVANRVAEIQGTIPFPNWNHVRSEHNPADCASRGLLSEELQSHGLWWNGPTWLSQPSFNSNCGSPTVPSTTLEEKKAVRVHMAISEPELVTRFSSWPRLLRVSAYVMRAVSNMRSSKANRVVSFLTVPELRAAELFWLKRHQQLYFADDLKELQRIASSSSDPTAISSTLRPKSRLISLTPFIDNDGIIRVGGRLTAARVSYDKRNPIVLDPRSSMVEMIMSCEHLRLLHAGPQLLLASLSQRYWILRGREKCRNVCRKCIVGHRHKGETMKQLMGSLPSTRINPSRPFRHCGVDFAGPFSLKVMRGRGQKRFKAYVSVFVCFATRAIHLELVSSLTTEAFLAALRRFMARRGLPAEIRSDCGSNFLGTRKEIREMQSFLANKHHHDAINSNLSAQGVRWLLNPASAPHFGGIWEAGVRSVKYHLKRIMGLCVFDFEEMTTALTQIEACLNSRPLAPTSSDPSDLTVLTPGHFLIQDSMLSLPDPDLSHLPTGRLDRWQRVQLSVQHFWKRWSREYLTRLQQRPKWHAQQQNLKPGDLVLVKDDRLPPLNWKLGRITEVHPGPDNNVRVVSLKTADGFLKRPIVKLSLLPFESCNDTDEF